MNAAKNHVKSVWNKLPRWAQRLVEIWAAVMLLATLFSGCATRFHLWEVIADTLHVATFDTLQTVALRDSVNDQRHDVAISGLAASTRLMELGLVLTLLPDSEQNNLRLRIAFDHVNADSLLRVVLVRPSRK